MEILPKSSFFRENCAADLPEPEEVRTLNRLSGNDGSTSFDRPPPVIIPSLCLVVKYGRNVTTDEARTQVMVYERLTGQVPVPEVFDWTEDENQRFIYVFLIKSDQLNTRRPKLSESERQAVCRNFRQMVEARKAVEQDEDCRYLGESNL
ncbi:phosphotransferase family protein [Pestalotiopsis sp. NC0098]|nr:phosphotransferase family protein [Pestalotiopsis sp. NC0098]